MPPSSTSTEQTGWLLPLVNDLVAQIFIGEQSRLGRTEVGLVNENHKLGGPADSFQYQGHLIRKPETTAVIAGQHSKLHPTLYAAAEKHIKDLTQIELDKRWVAQALVLLLRSCSSIQDIFDALPNSLHQTLVAVRPNAKGLERTRQDAWTIQDNPRALAQYSKLREKMEFYNISRLVY